MVLFSRDEAFTAYMSSAFPGLEVLSGLDEFDRRISDRRAQAIFIDCDDHRDGQNALKLVRQSRASAASATVAIINGETVPSDAQDMGAWHVVQKVEAWKSLEPLQDWLKSVRRREHYRFPVNDVALIDSGLIIGRVAKLVNISLGGASLVTSGADELEHHIVLRLSAGRFPCDVVWREPSGRVGVCFVGSRFTAADLRRVVGTNDRG